MTPKAIARTSTNFIIIALCIVAVALLQNSRLNSTAFPAKDSVEELNLEERKDERFLKLAKQMPAFGFDNLVADWIYLKSIQYVGDRSARQKTGYSLAPVYFEAVITHDPRFIRAYQTLSPVTSMLAGRSDKSVALMEKGLQSLSPEFPDAYFLWLYKGTDELLFFGDIKEAKHSYEMAAKWASVHDDQQSQRRAASARETVKFLSQNPDVKQAQVRAWRMVLRNAPDKRTRQIAINYIEEELGGKVLVNEQGNLKIELP